MFENEKEIVPKILYEAFENKIKKQFIENDFGVFHKGNNDLVTSCDIETEKYIIDNIRNFFPNDTVLSEELNNDKQMERRTWIIDPIDGTVNFSNSIKLFGIQMALVIHHEPVFSVIYLPFFNEMYVAIKGEGSYLNGIPIHVSKEKELHASLLTFGDFSHSNHETRDKQIHIMNQIYHSVRKVRMFGASSIDFSLLASGKTHVHMMFSKNLWDILPGYLIASETGAVSNYDPLNHQDFIVVASNQSLLISILEQIKN